MHVFSLEGYQYLYGHTNGINEISHALRHELNFVFMSLTNLIVAKFTAHPQMDVEEPNQNVEQEQRKFAF